MKSPSRSLNAPAIALLILIGCPAVAPAQLDVSIAGMERLSWEAIAPGVWSARIGARDPMTFTDLAGGPPQTEALGRMGEGAFPFDAEETRGDVVGGRTSIRLPLGEDESIYGLGLQFRGINRTSQVHHLAVDHYGGVLGRTHAPVPFYVSSRGYGVLFNTVNRISVYPGVGNRKDGRLPPRRDRTTDPAWSARPRSDAVEASAMVDGMEVLVFAGEAMLDAVRRYNLYFGGGVLPPRWGLGFWHRVPTSATAKEVLAEADEFRKRDFPLDVVGLEPGWQSWAYPGSFDWSEARFPDPEGFMKAMAERDLHVNLWENPYVSPESSIYESILPFTGSHTVWLGAVPDYTIEQARDVLTAHHESTQLEIGVSGYKIDEVDGIDAWLWPDHATFPSATSGVRMRQTYGLQIQKMLGAMFRARNTRTYGLVRGSNAGASAHPFVIYSDHYSHKGYVTALCNTSFAGVLWTPEIRSARTDDEWVRRMQTVCFSPMAMLNAWSSGMKPWSREDVIEPIRDAMKWRARFLPYLYTAFARYRFEGIPPFRAMLLEEGLRPYEAPQDEVLTEAELKFNSAIARDIGDQYMMGDCLLVAPLFAGETERNVILPRGNWYDFYSGDLAGSGEMISVAADLSTIPLFVRGGGIIPLLREDTGAADWKRGVNIEARHYGDASSTAMLYDDDGTTFDFENGRFSWHALRAMLDASGEWSGSIEQVSGSYARSFGEISWTFMTQ